VDRVCGFAQCRPFVTGARRVRELSVSRGVTASGKRPRLLDAETLPSYVTAQRPGAADRISQSVWNNRMSVQYTVLIVDDNRSIRPLLRRLLEAAGYRAIEAPTGAEAIRLIGDDAGPIDLLVTDVRMPGIGGVELGEILAERFAGLRILFMSGESHELAEQQAAMNPIRAFLPKPFTADVFLAAVREVLSA
jgi:CheY-like chemotaxis protein